MSTWTRDAASLRARVEIAFDSGPKDDPAIATWTDVTTDVERLQVRRGRQAEDVRMNVGTMRLQLQDRDGRYDATTNSIVTIPNAGNKIPGRRVRARISDIGSLYEGCRADRFFPLGEASGTVAFDRGAADGMKPPVRSNGTYSGGVTFGQTGAHLLESRTSVQFNGTTGKMVGGGTFVPGTISIAGWFRHTGTVDRWIGGVKNFIRIGLNSSTKLEAAVLAGTSWQYVESPATVSANAWHQFAVTWSATTGHLILYVDGARVAAGTTSGNVTTTPASIALAANASDGTTKLWSGRLQDVGIWHDYVLTDEQIRRLHVMSSEGWWLFNGFVDAWEQERGSADVGIATAFLDCSDGGTILQQYNIILDARSETLAAVPWQYFTFDDDTLADAQGGRPAEIQAGARVNIRDMVPDGPTNGSQLPGFTPLNPSVTTGISSGSLTMTPLYAPDTLPLAFAQVLIPDVFVNSIGGSYTSAAAFWFKSDGADPLLDVGDTQVNSGFMPCLYAFEPEGTAWRHWHIGVDSNGLFAMRTELRPTMFRQYDTPSSRVSRSWGSSVTNDQWHHLAFVMTGTQTTIDGIAYNADVYVDGEKVTGELKMPVPTSVRMLSVMGGYTTPYSIDELALWYNTTGAPTEAQLKLIYEVGATQFAGDTTTDRCTRILDIAGWTGPRSLSTSADTTLPGVRSGSAWDQLQLAANANLGTFDIAANGTARLLSRHDRRRMGALPTNVFDNGGVGGYADIKVVTDDRYLYSSARVDSSFYEDATSAAKYGRRTFELSVGLDSNEAAAVAAGMVERYKEFSARFVGLEWKLPSAIGGAGLALDVGDFIAVSRQPFAGASRTYQECHVEQLTVDVDASTLSATISAQLSPADPRQNTYFECGSSTLGSTDILGW